jgi:alpha-beta hydrolase superfamily lysophospholipase/SAM-dependent methyltransferase
MQNDWQELESGFDAGDGQMIYYRAWRPVAQETGPDKALVFLHRGHEHSARVTPLVRDLGFKKAWAFAWDARGHGHSPGARGDAPDFQTLVRDLDTFMKHIRHCYGIELHNTVLVANSVGAVLAATWLHDHGHQVAGVVMAAAAFQIKLYVPLAIPALDLALRFKPDLSVSSYIRPRMLTHDIQQASAYAQDPLITSNISARVLLGLAQAAQRVVSNAHALDVPILMLIARQDHVVKNSVQRKFFDGLSTTLKKWVELPNCRHAIFYESESTRNLALQHSREFISACWSQSLKKSHDYVSEHENSESAHLTQRLMQDRSVSLPARIFFAIQRTMLTTLGRLSKGMRIGLQHGFDSGASLDHVYQNQAQGYTPLGRFIDRGYLDAIGWRGIRLRKEHLEKSLNEAINRLPRDRPVRILDVAAGHGRYVLETIKRHQDRNITVTLRDRDEKNLEHAQSLALSLGMANKVKTQCRDAFDPNSYADDTCYDIVIVSGLYELFSDNRSILCSLDGIARQLSSNGYLIVTGQPWHPQQALIAKTLRNHLGQPWIMRLRPQRELNALLQTAGFEVRDQHIGLQNIFNVTVARRVQQLCASD